MYHEIHRYPHTNLNEANLDYICHKIGEVERTAESASEAAALAETVKDEAEAIKDEVTATGEAVREQYEIVIEKAGEIGESAEQIETNKNNITLLSNGLASTNASVIALSDAVDDIEAGAAQIYSNGHLIKVDVECTPSPTNIDETGFSSSVKKYNQLDMIFAKIYARTARALGANNLYPIAFVRGSSNYPSYDQPLSVYVHSHKVADVRINEEGEIGIYPYETIAVGTAIYITGFWRIS